MKATAPTATTCATHMKSPFALLATGSKRPVRIPPPIITTRPVLRGDRHYLRALRAAEMAVWNAGIPAAQPLPQ